MFSRLATLNWSDAEKNALASNLREIGSKLLKEFNEGTAHYREHNHVQPIMSIVTVLPKDELAEMAESLVNLTSFKQKISMDIETVGGPVDVAVISKGDGFIWIKRKHYFKAEYNPRFIASYYRPSQGQIGGDE